ncbi:glycosyltransferase family 2 protein [Spirillospora sp. NPDC048911]|uniref:glycosyltransferase family 2 protein n=1 Tax=Spirillospora sp. NPDC048911 TaxID=3364527 RepID=UPI00372294FA
MPRVLVGIPWRPQPHRVYAHDLTAARYRELLPNATVIDVDTIHEPFCLAGCRNQAVRLAEAAGFDVVVLGDADTLPEPGPLRAAIEAAATSDVVHLPYTEYRSLRQAGTSQFLAGMPLEDCRHLVVDGACSGIYVVRPDTWWRHGGQDERFLGWGGEDAAWYAAHTCLLGAEPVRHEGRVYALHHEGAQKEGDQYTANFALVYRYHQAQHDPDAMRSLITGSVTCAKSTLSTGG